MRLGRGTGGASPSGSLAANRAALRRRGGSGKDEYPGRASPSLRSSLSLRYLDSLIRSIYIKTLSFVSGALVVPPCEKMRSI